MCAKTGNTSRAIKESGKRGIDCKIKDGDEERDNRPKGREEGHGRKESGSGEVERIRCEGGPK